MHVVTREQLRFYLEVMLMPLTMSEIDGVKPRFDSIGLLRSDYIVPKYAYLDCNYSGQALRFQLEDPSYSERAYLVEVKRPGLLNTLALPITRAKLSLRLIVQQPNPIQAVRSVVSGFLDGLLDELDRCLSNK